MSVKELLLQIETDKKKVVCLPFISAPQSRLTVGDPNQNCQRETVQDEPHKDVNVSLEVHLYR